MPMVEKEAESFSRSLGYDRGLELEGGRDDKSIDGVGGRELVFGEDVTCPLSRDWSELGDADAWIVEQVIDGGVVVNTPTDFCENRSGHTHECTLVVGKAQNSCGTSGLG